MCGNDVGKHGAACTAGKAILPILSSCVIPIRLRIEFIVTDLHMQHNVVGICATLFKKHIALPQSPFADVSSMDPC